MENNKKPSQVRMCYEEKETRKESKQVGEKID